MPRDNASNQHGTPLCHARIVSLSLLNYTPLCSYAQTICDLASSERLAQRPQTKQSREQNSCSRLRPGPAGCPLRYSSDNLIVAPTLYLGRDILKRQLACSLLRTKAIAGDGDGAACSATIGRYRAHDWYAAIGAVNTNIVNQPATKTIIVQVNAIEAKTYLHTRANVGCQVGAGDMPGRRRIKSVIGVGVSIRATNRILRRVEHAERVPVVPPSVETSTYIISKCAGSTLSISHHVANVRVAFEAEVRSIDGEISAAELGQGWCICSLLALSPAVKSGLPGSCRPAPYW